MAQIVEKELHPVVRRKSGVRRALQWILALAVLGAIAAGSYALWERLSRVESTDDAQIDATIAPINSRIAGNVVSVLVGDGQSVKAGDVLVQLDKRDLEVAVAKARAELADSEAVLAGARSDIPVATASTTSALSSARSAREDAAAAVEWAGQQVNAARARQGVAQANVRVAQANRSRAAQDVERYQALVTKDEIPRQTYDQAVATEQAAAATVDAQQALVNEAQQNVAAAEKSVEQARAKLQQAEAAVQAALTGPQQVLVSEAHALGASAQVAIRRIAVQQAELNLSYTTMVAPVSGVVGRKAVEVGQNIAPGQQLMAVVALDDIWVTANFKETQLKDMRIGQRVNIEVDANGRTYTGRVERFYPASGAKFSLLPPENATGNFVKVVQRIPVRISIDPGQNQDHALRPGMSVTPKVEIR